MPVHRFCSHNLHMSAHRFCSLAQLTRARPSLLLARTTYTCSSTAFARSLTHSYSWEKLHIHVSTYSFNLMWGPMFSFAHPLANSLLPITWGKSFNIKRGSLFSPTVLNYCHFMRQKTLFCFAGEPFFRDENDKNSLPIISFHVASEFHEASSDGCPLRPSSSFISAKVTPISLSKASSTDV